MKSIGLQFRGHGFVLLVGWLCLWHLSCSALPMADHLPRSRDSPGTTHSLLELEEKVIEALGPRAERQQVARFNVSPSGCWVSVVMVAKFGMVDPGGRGDEIYVVDVCRQRVRSFRGSGLSWAPQADILWSIDTSGRLVVYDGVRGGAIRRKVVKGLSLAVPGNFIIFGEVVPLSASSGVALGFSPEQMEDFVFGESTPLVCEVSDLDRKNCSRAGAGETWYWKTALDSERVGIITLARDGSGEEWFEILGLKGVEEDQAVRVRLPSATLSAAVAPGRTQAEAFVAAVVGGGEESVAFFILDWESQSLQRLEGGRTDCGADFSIGVPGIKALRRTAEGWEVLLDVLPGEGPRYFKVGREGRVLCKG